MSEDEEIEPISEAMMRSRRTWLKGLLLGVALIVLGGVIGSSLTVMAIKQQRDRDRFEQSKMLPRLVERVTNDMDLSGQQKSQIDAIVLSHQRSLDDIHHEFRHEAEAEISELKEGIAAVLTPDQQVYWEKDWSKMLEKTQGQRGDRNRDDHDRDRREDDSSNQDR